MKAATHGARRLAGRGWFLLGGICETAPALVLVVPVLYLQGKRLIGSNSRLEQAAALMTALYLSLLYLSALVDSYRRLRADQGK